MEFETKVEEIIKRTHNVSSFRFPRPKSLDYKAGQFIFITIKIGNEEARKHFTLSSSPTEKGFVEFTKKFTGHTFSNALESLEVVDWVKIDAPMAISPLRKGNTKRLACFQEALESRLCEVSAEIALT